MEGLPKSPTIALALFALATIFIQHWFGAVLFLGFVPWVLIEYFDTKRWTEEEIGCQINFGSPKLFVLTL